MVLSFGNVACLPFLMKNLKKEIGDSAIKECSTIEDLYKIAIG